MALLVQKYLEDHSFEDLEKEHGVEASFGDDFMKCSLNYSQLFSKDDDRLAQQCRGLILAPQWFSKKFQPGLPPGKTVVAARPMDRFFNFGQGAAAEINWNNVVAEEKLDGTLCIVYFDDRKGEWHVATRRSPEANIPIDGFKEFTFRTLFEKAFLETVKVSFSEFFALLPISFTYCFELTTPLNRIVVDYQDYRVTLLSVHSNHTTLEVINVGEVSNWLSNLPRPRNWKLSSLEDCVTWVNEQNPLNLEGLVVRDGTKRIKIKNASYVFYNRARDELASSPRNILQLVINEKIDDVMDFLPKHIQERAEIIKNSFAAFLHDQEMYYASLVSLSSGSDIKGFAQLVQLTEKINSRLWPPPMFAIYRLKAHNVKDFILGSQKDGCVSSSMLDTILQKLSLYGGNDET